MKISVIIPCYNAEKYLDQCLKSVLGQTLQDIEIICVDDGSTDNTLNMLYRYAEEDSRLKVLRQQNKFAGVARNTGIDAAQGEYIAFLDADDYYEINGLEKAYAIATEHQLDMLKLSSSLLDDPTGEITTNAHYSHERFPLKGQVVCFRDDPYHLLNCADVAWNGLYKKSFLQESGIRFNNFRCVNDRSFYISCMVTAKRIMIADEYLTCYRRNIPGSLVSVRYRFFECQINSYKLIRSIVGNADIEQNHRELVMQHDLSQIFIWYEKFLASGINTFGVEQIIREFLGQFEVSDVGADYLKRFPYKHVYRRFQESRNIRWHSGEISREPLVSVIIPVFNCAGYLSECLESVLLQSMEDFELICVDNGSTDASMEILRCFADKDSRIRIMEESQSGAGPARNTAVRSATGKYLVFVDADDKIKRNYLQMLCDAAQNYNAQVVVSPRISWDGKGEGMPMKNWIANKRIPHDRVFSYVDVPDYIINFTDGAPGGKLFDRVFALEKGLYFLLTRRSEDFNFIFGGLAVAERILSISDCGYYYRKNNPNSLESTKDETPLEFWVATELFMENMKKLPYYEQIKRSILNSAVNRAEFNTKAVNTFEGFSEVFYKLKEVASSELEVDQHESKYFFEESGYRALKEIMKYETPGDFLFAHYKKGPAQTNRGQTPSAATPAGRPVGKLTRMLMYIPRKLRGLVWCINDHGFSYTVKYAFRKLANKLK